MNTENITYKPLKVDFTSKGFRHTQLYREGDFAIFHKVAVAGSLHTKPFDGGFEVVVISRHNGYEIAGVKVEPSEVYPGNEKWGSMGWTYTNLMDAELRLQKLLGGETEIETNDSSPEPEETEEPAVVQPKVQGRGRPKKEQGPIKLPEKEFTMQEIADLNGMDKPNMYVIMKEFIAKGEVKEVRRESRGKGRPTVIYGKA